MPYQQSYPAKAIVRRLIGCKATHAHDKTVSLERQDDDVGRKVNWKASHQRLACADSMSPTAPHTPHCRAQPEADAIVQPEQTGSTINLPTHSAGNQQVALTKTLQKPQPPRRPSRHDRGRVKGF